MKKLKDFYNTDEFQHKCTEVNVDDIFRFVQRQGLEKVELNGNEMQTLVSFMLVNRLQNSTGDVHLTGIADKFLGVNIKYNPVFE